MFASLASDVGRELLVELRARDEIIREAKRADGIYEEEEEDEEDGDENNNEEGDGEDALYDENENIHGALLEKNSFVPSDAETRSVLATKDGAIAILLETFEASLEIVLLHAKASRLEDSSASSPLLEKRRTELPLDESSPPQRSKQRPRARIARIRPHVRFQPPRHRTALPSLLRCVSFYRQSHQEKAQVHLLFQRYSFLRRNDSPKTSKSSCPSPVK